jgi:hypothetical protein
MCHGYEMKWWKSEKAAREAKQNLVRAKQDEAGKAAPEKKAEEKELIPAE